MEPGQKLSQNCPSVESYKALLETTLDHSIMYLNDERTAPISASYDVHELRRQLDLELTSGGVDAKRVIDDLVHGASKGLVRSTSGRFFAWVIGGTLPVSLAADWLTSVWDQNAALFATSPASAVIEEVCGKWLKEVLGLPATTSFALVTGCQMAHATCLVAARNSLLAKAGWDVEKKGLFRAPRIRFFSANQHGSIDRALRLIGLGTDAILRVEQDSEGQMSGDALRQALEDNADTLKVVHLQAGDINTGGFDDFEEIIPICREFGAWVHVDGAFGLWANGSPKLRTYLKGVEKADSWATDGHKWLNVPFDSGYAFVANSQSHRSAMSHDASYITLDAAARDEMDFNPEWSRRSRGIATYAALRHLGTEGVANLVERTSEYAKSLVERIGRLDGAEVVSPARINQGLVRFIDPRPGSRDRDHNQRTDQTISDVVRLGDTFFQGTTWNGKRCMRVSVCNWQTDDRDVDAAVGAVERALANWRPFYN